MIEKVRVTLWDIFAFFISGLILSMWGLINLLVADQITLSEFIQDISNIPASICLFFIPLSLTAIGMMYEPIANYFDKIINIFWFHLFPAKKKHQDEENILKDLIRTKYLGDVAEKISNPYHLCKEYVETKQLSTTFMVFLSRYGFYRNVAFLAIVSIPSSLYHCGLTLKGISWSALFFCTAIIMKFRAEDFYSYLAPCVYRCYLIDKALNNKKDNE